MKLTIPNFTQNHIAFMRSCGYAFDHETKGEASCMRRVSGYDYPRYHAYVHIEETQNPKLETNGYPPCKQPVSTRSSRGGREAGKLKTKNLIVNLHIDQKKPSYRNTAAHSGEYDGELVERELERIKGCVE